MSVAGFASHLLRDSTQRKHLVRWLGSLRKNYLLERRKPWIVFDALDFLESIPLNGARVFEYGSGGSTLYWLARGAECVSIEHDQVWYAMMRERLKDTGRIDYRLVRPQPSPEGGSGDPSDPDDYSSDDAAFAGQSFRSYVTQIDAFPSEYFDVVLIDGRARPSCVKHSVPKVKIGGSIILDNADRGYYLAHTKQYLLDFVTREFVGAGPVSEFFTRTHVYSRLR
jgi:hypothetical protein